MGPAPRTTTDVADANRCLVDAMDAACERLDDRPVLQRHPFRQSVGVARRQRRQLREAAVAGRSRQWRKCLEQRWDSPRRQKTQVPSTTLGSTATRSPSARPETAAPIATTTPLYSCPSTTGTRAGCSPRKIDRSVPQTPQFATRMTISSSAHGGSSRSTRASEPGRVRTEALTSDARLVRRSSTAMPNPATGGRAGFQGARARRILR